MPLTPDPDDEAPGLPVAPIPPRPPEAHTADTLIAQIERLLDERHTRLADNVTVQLDQTRSVVGALHEDMSGLGVGQEAINQRIDALRADVRGAIAERNVAIAALRREVDELRDRVNTIEQTMAVLQSPETGEG